MSRFFEKSTHVFTDVQSINLNLEHNTHLHTLHIGGLDLPKFSTKCAAILARVASPNLRTLELSIHVAEPADVYSAEWGHIDSMLACDTFAGVAVTFHVAVSMQHGFGKGSAEQVLRSFFPQLLENGTLSVSSV